MGLPNSLSHSPPPPFPSSSSSSLPLSAELELTGNSELLRAGEPESDSGFAVIITDEITTEDDLRFSLSPSQPPGLSIYDLRDTQLP